jgi:hypothetical protein
MIAHLGFHERTEVNWRMAGLRSGRHPDDGDAREKSNTTNHFWAHEHVPPAFAADRAAAAMVANGDDIEATRTSNS